MDPEHVRALWAMLAEKADELEDDSVEPIVITMVSHPHSANS
jgi:hypothetical protein